MHRISLQDIQSTYSYRSLRPALSCEHPYKTRNKQTGEVIVARCNHCPSCLYLKSLNLTKRLETECTQHKYSIFFTLTYDNDHLPLLHFEDSFVQKSSDNSLTLYHSFVLTRLNDAFTVDTKGRKHPFSPVRTFYVDFTSDQLSDLRNPTHLSGRNIAVCYKPDVQAFVKRLQINLVRTLSKLYPKKYAKLTTKTLDFRYYIAAEYGPKSLRPHYHGLAWTDNADIAQLLLADGPKGQKGHGIISKNWPLCTAERVDVQPVSSTACNYVASYVSGTFGLPKVLQTKYFRPFTVCSTSPCIGCYKVNDETLQDLLNHGFVPALSSRVKKNGSTTFSIVLPTKQILCRFFAKCHGFSDKNVDYLVRLYHKYSNGRYVKPKFVKNEPTVISCFNIYNSKTKTLTDASADASYTDSYNYQDYCFFRCVKRYVDLGFSVRYVCKRFIELYKSLDYFLLVSHLALLDNNYKFGGEKAQIATQINNIFELPLYSSPGKFDFIEDGLKSYKNVGYNTFYDTIDNFPYPDTLVLNQDFVHDCTASNLFKDYFNHLRQLACRQKHTKIINDITGNI